MALLPHLHARNIGIVSADFRATGRGSPKEVEPPPVRREHGQKLRGDLVQTAALLADIRKEQGRLKVPLKQRGMAIAVESRDGIPLVVSSTARSTTQGLKLLNFQTNPNFIERNEPKIVDLATFFISKDTVQSLLKALDRYESWEDEGDFADLLGNDDEGASRRPANFKLFESAASIRPANLRDFWTDTLDRFPRKRGEALWEVWTRRDYEGALRLVADSLNLRADGRATEFIETSVRNIYATPEKMQELIRFSGAVVELRSASSFAGDFMEIAPSGRRQLVTSLAQKLVPAPSTAPRVVVLDTGVNFANPLLAGSLPRTNCYSVSDDWALTDHDGHGTKMAGVALLGDLASLPSGPNEIPLSISLESVVVSAPHGSVEVPARDAVQKAVELVEGDNVPRVYCLAQTAVGESEDGRPTSTSAALDSLIYGDGIRSRLFCAAVGNVPHSTLEPYQVAEYLDRNKRHGVQSPAQALNVISVGAMTNKVAGPVELVAPAGDMAPTSRTSQEWPSAPAKKPDIVMEGGNFRVEAGGVFSRASPENLVLTTSRLLPDSPIAMTGETSAATAQVSGLAGRLMARYPLFRTETVRGMLVHSAEWTPTMMAQRQELEHATSRNEAWMTTFARYGWGVPNEQRLFASTESAMTLIIEDELQPYELADNGQVRLKEMKYFKLPWPQAQLKALGQTNVEMRCTLSYFAEPDPNAIARNRYDRYPSHRLKFDLRRFGESDLRAQSRYNALGEDDESAAGQDDGWIAGKRLQQKGTLLQDIWNGPAYRLAERDGISVAPVKGWWADIRDSGRYQRSVRFSLIVSVRIPEGRANIYQPVSTAIPARNRVANGIIASVTT